MCDQFLSFGDGTFLFHSVTLLEPKVLKDKTAFLQVPITLKIFVSL